MSDLFDGTQLCAQTDPEVFFPMNNFHRKADFAFAVSICKQCPLMVACLEYANKQNGSYGVWGGQWFDGSGYVSPAVVERKEVAA